MSALAQASANPSVNLLGAGLPRGSSPWLIHYLTIWRSWSPWGRWLRVGPALLFLAASMACAFTAQWALMLPVFLFLFGLWALIPLTGLLSGLMQLNHPMLARALPRSTQTLRQAMASLVFGVLVLGAAWVGAVVWAGLQMKAQRLGHRLPFPGDEWAFIESVAFKSLFGIMVFLWIVFQAARGRQGPLFIVFFGLAIIANSSSAIAQALAQLPGWTSLLSGMASGLSVLQGLGAAPLRVLVGLFCVAFSVIAARLCIGDGGPAHRERWTQHESARQAMAGGQGGWVGALQQTDRQGMLRRLLEASYSAAASQAPSSQPFAKGMMLLGPSLHAPSLQRIALGACTPLLLYIALMHLSGASSVPAHMLFMLVSVGTVAALQRLTSGLMNTTDEQALLVLLPGMPQGSALNRPLAQHLRRCFAWVWLASAVLLALATWALAADQPFFLILAGLVSGGLPWLGLARVWARHPRVLSAWRHQVPLMLTLLLALVVSAAIGWLPRIGYAWGSGVIATVVFLALASWLVWRWHRMPKEPGPFPLGRMAGRKASAAGANANR